MATKGKTVPITIEGERRKLRNCFESSKLEGKNSFTYIGLRDAITGCYDKGALRAGREQATRENKTENPYCEGIKFQTQINNIKSMGETIDDIVMEMFEYECDSNEYAPDNTIYYRTKLVKFYHLAKSIGEESCLYKGLRDAILGNDFNAKTLLIGSNEVNNHNPYALGYSRLIDVVKFEKLGGNRRELGWELYKMGCNPKPNYSSITFGKN